MPTLREKVAAATARQGRPGRPLDGLQILVRTEDVASLLDALTEVTAIHYLQEQNFGRPDRCGHDRYDWPCPTMRAVRGAR